MNPQLPSHPDQNSLEQRFTLNVQMTREEFFAAWRGLMARRPQHWALVVLGIGVGSVGVAAQSIAVTMFGGVFTAYLLLNAFLLAPHQFWRRSPLREAYVLEVDTDGVTARASDITSAVGWSRWTKVIKCGNAYAFQSRRSVLFVPTRAFAESVDEERFREFVARCHVRSPEVGG